jgi:hypothetical protein
MVSDSGRELPPGVGAFRPEEVDNFDRQDHAHGWSIAVDRALENIGRSPGRWNVSVTFGAVVNVENPGNIIEYIATIS